MCLVVGKQIGRNMVIYFYTCLKYKFTIKFVKRKNILYFSHEWTQF